MKNNGSSGGCMLSLPLVIGLIVLGVIAAAATMALVSSSFGKGFAEGGGSMELFSDDIIATNNGDGVTIAAKDSEIGDVTNTVTPSREEEELGVLFQLCLPLLVIGLVFGAYIYLSSNGSNEYY